MLIYFVDEDIGGKSAYPIALKMRGHFVDTVPDATQALAQLPTAKQVELVIIDVMLSSGIDPESNFEYSQTRKGLQTGLVLLEHLVRRNPAIYPARAVLLSAATDQELVSSIQATEAELTVPYWNKAAIKSTKAFCEKVEARLDHLERLGVP